MIIITWIITSQERFNDRNLTLYVITNETKKYLALWMPDIVIHNTSWNTWYNSFNLLRVVWLDDFSLHENGVNEKTRLGSVGGIDESHDCHDIPRFHEKRKEVLSILRPWAASRGFFVRHKNSVQHNSNAP